MRRKAAVAVSMLAAVGCVGPSRPTIGNASPAQISLYARLLRSADARRLDPSALDGALASRLPWLRAAAALSIGQAGDTARAQRLLALVNDADTAVAASAAFALGLLRDTAGVPALEAAIRRPGSSPATGESRQVRPTLASEAAWSLGEIGLPARGALEGALRDTMSVAGAALPQLLLAAAKLEPAPVELLIPFLRAADPAVRSAATYAIARPRLPGGVRAILSVVRSADAEGRAHCARALAKSAAGDSLAEPAVAALNRLARDSDPHVRINALRSLATYGTVARGAVVAALEDPDPNVRIAAAEGLGPVLGSAMRDWRAAWSADTGFAFHRAVLVSALSADVRLPALEEWTDSADWRYRAAVADAGGAAPEMARLRDVALPLARDRDARVRAAVYVAMAARVDSSSAHPWRREFLAYALRDPDPIVRSAALDGLARRATARELPRVLDSYELARGDSLPDARLAALRYLAAAWRADSLAFGGDVRSRLTSYEAPADPLARRVVRDVTPLRRWASAPASAPHDLGWYEHLARTLVVSASRSAAPAVDIVTERGSVVLELFPHDAPLTVANFLALAGSGFFRDCRFHRVVPNFVVQDGDPRGDGSGGPTYTIRDELNRRRYARGVVGMALSGPDTGGSQYFITLSGQPHLDGHYTAFGRVRDGVDVLDRLVQGDRILDVRVR